MSKTNRERALDVYAKAHNGAECIVAIKTALDKAEKRGRRKGITCQPCSCPKCGEQLIMPRMIVKQEVKPQFDVERVRGLIADLNTKAVGVGVALHKPDLYDYIQRRDTVYEALLSALGIDDE